jgi:hypothetical protein
MSIETASNQIYLTLSQEMLKKGDDEDEVKTTVKLQVCVVAT